MVQRSTLKSVSKIFLSIQFKIKGDTIPMFYLLIGFLIGLFLPSPIDELVKKWIKGLWNMIFKKKEAE